MTEKAGGYQIGGLLRQLTRSYQTLMLRELKEHGMTPPQMLTLLQVIQDPKTIGQISAAIHLSYSTVSGIIDRLERDGLLERVRDEADRRIIWIRKTEKFEQLRETFSVYQESFYDQLFSDLSEEEHKSIIHSLETLISHLQTKISD